MQQLIKTVIIEDESGPRTALKNQVMRYCPELELIGEAGTLDEGRKLLIDHRPDLVFLDIQLRGGNAFDLLDVIKPLSFKVIFVTGYEQYAVRAFDYNALHYILKPIVPEELVKALKRARKQQHSSLESLRDLLAQLRFAHSEDRIAVPSLSKISYVYPIEIVRLESDAAYTTLHMESGTQILSTRPLKEYDAMLSGCGFFRVHRSHLINLSKVKEFRKGRQERVLLEDGSLVEVSRKKKEALLEAIPLLGKTIGTALKHKRA